MKIADVRIGRRSRKDPGAERSSLASLLLGEMRAARPGKRVCIDADKREDFYVMEMPQRYRQTQPRRNHDMV
jgi:hypothetical protein